MLIAMAAFCAVASAVAWALSALLGFWCAFSAVVGAFSLVALVSQCRSHLKIIHDFPTKGALRWHWSAWRFQFYDRFLDPRVDYARHALAIDERRKDFAWVPWGAHKDVAAARSDWMVSRWFAGNHSDIGGSYPEDESRLSDIALNWMAKEAEGVPNGIIIDWTKLNLFPDPSGMQHCEVTGFFDSYSNWVPKGLRWTWPVEPRMDILVGNCDPSVLQRLALPAISNCGVSQPYRPGPLRNDPTLSQLYQSAAEPNKTSRNPS